MKIHEYQAKTLFEEFGIPVLGGQVAETAEEAVKYGIVDRVIENKKDA